MNAAQTHGTRFCVLGLLGSALFMFTLAVYLYVLNIQLGMCMVPAAFRRVAGID